MIWNQLGRVKSHLPKIEERREKREERSENREERREKREERREKREQRRENRDENREKNQMQLVSDIVSQQFSSFKRENTHLCTCLILLFLSKKCACGIREEF